MGNFKVIWSNSAKAQLKAIYNYYKVEKKTLQGARNVRYDILRAAKNIQFKAQYQKDEIQPEYRRIIVRHFKLLYKEINGNIVILRIFNTFQNPKTQSEG
jgi:plasmid stabilization system protein ParE